MTDRPEDQDDHAGQVDEIDENRPAIAFLNLPLLIAKKTFVAVGDEIQNEMRSKSQSEHGVGVADVMADQDAGRGVSRQEQGRLVYQKLWRFPTV